MNHSLPPYNEDAPGLEVAHPDENWIYPCQAVAPADAKHAVPVENDEKIVTAIVSSPIPPSQTTDPLPAATRRSRKKFLIFSSIGAIIIIVIILGVVLGVRASSQGTTGTQLTPAGVNGTSAVGTAASVTSTPSSTQSSHCVGGSNAPGMSGNYVGLCSFACSYDYCPPGPCVCTAHGSKPVPTPPVTGGVGCPLPDEDDSYLGLCSFACNHGYCPPAACSRNCTKTQ